MHSYWRMVGASVAIATLAGCGGHGGGAAAVPVPAAQKVDTAAVLAQARVASETAQPYGVDDGALQFTDTSDTSQPIDVNGN